MDDLSFEHESPHAKYGANPAYFVLHPSMNDPARLYLQCGSGDYEDCGDFEFSRAEATLLRNWLTNWLNTFQEGK